MALLIKILAIVAIIFASGCISANYLMHQPSNALEGPFKVVRVIDGDTIVLNNTEHVRFSGIDSTEIGECYHDEAKNKLASLISGKDVLLEKDFQNRDKYKRLLRYIHYNNTTVNFILVSEGYAQVYDKYASTTKYYAQLKSLESTAINHSLGIWKCPNLIDK